jgi:hypothetical protein
MDTKTGGVVQAKFSTLRKFDAPPAPKTGATLLRQQLNQSISPETHFTIPSTTRDNLGKTTDIIAVPPA